MKKTETGKFRNKNQTNMTKKRTMISLETKNTLYQASGLLCVLCFIVSFTTTQFIFADIPTNKSQLFEVNGVIERKKYSKHEGIQVKDFITGETYECSTLCNYTGREEDIGKTGKFLIYKSTVSQIEVDGKMRMSYDGTVKVKNYYTRICIYSFVLGVISILIFWKVA